MRLGLSLGQYEFDLLGEALVAALNFALGGFNPELTFESSVVNRRVRCGEAFGRQDGRWFMTTDFLPGDPAIKALGVDNAALVLETAPLEATEVQDLIRQRMLPVRWDRQRRLLLDTASRRLIGRIEDDRDLNVQLPAELLPRCLWTLPWSKLSEVQRLEAIRFADLVYSAAAYVLPAEGEAGPTAPAASRVPQLRLQLGLEQRLELEQRPMLALNTALRTQTIQTTRLELQQLMALQQSILRMTPEELATFAARDLSPTGQAKTLRIFLFVLAGQVKRALAATKPDMTWREARQYARQLVESGARRLGGSNPNG